MNRGKVPENVLRRSVLKDIKGNKDVITGAAFGEDCAILNCNKISAAATATEQGDNAVVYALTRAVNNLAAGGFKAAFVSVNLTFPPETEESDIKAVQSMLQNAVNLLEASIVAGHTQISDAVKECIASVTVIGFAFGDRILSKKDIVAGDSIIATKYIGLEGGSILYDKAKDKISERFDERFLKRLSGYKDMLLVTKEGEIGSTFGVKAMKDVSEKGIFNALWELGSAANKGLKADLKAILVRQELIEVCNHLNINPYEMRSSGMMLMVTDRPDELLEMLAKEEIPASLIGRFTDNNDRIIVNEDEERHLDKIKQDEIYKII